MPEADIRYSLEGSITAPVYVPVSPGYPLPVRVMQPTMSTVNLSTQIQQDNVFQSIQGKNGDRVSGRIINPKTNSNPIWLFIGQKDEAEKDRSFYMQPGDPPFYLDVGIFGALSDELCVTGTKNEWVYAIIQVVMKND